MKSFLMLLTSVMILGASSMALAGTIEGKVEIEGKSDFENVIVYIDGVKGDFKPPAKRPQMNHVNLQFKPAVLPIMKGTTVDFPNSDSVFHSGFSISSANPFDLGLYGQGMEKFVHFGNSGVDELFCHIHSHMHAYVLALDNPYFTTTAKDGSFSIPNVPEGAFSVVAWGGPNSQVKKPAKISNGDQVTALNFRLTGK